MLQYATTANIFWMFVEGLFLHNRVAVSVFNREAPFRIFYCLGWGNPCFTKKENVLLKLYHALTSLSNTESHNPTDLV